MNMRKNQIYELPPGYKVVAVHSFPKDRRVYVLGRNSKTQLVYMFVFDRDISYETFVTTIRVV